MTTVISDSNFLKVVSVKVSMRIIACLIILVLIGCNQNDEISSLKNGRLLKQVKTGDKVNQTFEYNGDQLIQEFAFFDFCDNPVSEFTYSYDGGKITKLSTVDRAIYSAITTICDPKAGLKTEYTFEHDTFGRILRIRNTNSYTEFEYNSQGWVSSSILYGTNGQKINTSMFTYDSRGNIIQESDAKGIKTNYEYDDKVNPYYTINHRPQWISPFNKSPNNVVKATGSYNFERQFQYNAIGYPTQLVDSNGITYYFVYQ